MFSKRDGEKSLPTGADELSHFRFDTMKLLQCYLKRPIDEKIGVKPSEYINELQLSFKERQSSLKVDCELLFENSPPASVYDRWDVRPRFVLFNNWEPWEEYEAVFSVRNKYRTSKLLKVHMDKSDIFTLEEVLHLRRIASLVTATYKVKFKPREYRDYLYSATLTAEGDSFPIYILAIEPRPMINFPDSIDFGDVLVNYQNEKKIQIKNIGHLKANVNLKTDGNITFAEDKISLRPDGEFCLSLVLQSETIGLFKSQIIADFETGERVHITVKANCAIANIHLEKKNVQFDRTYIGLKSTKTLWLKNKTDKILKFRWLRTEDLEEDKLLLNKYGTYLKGIYESQRNKSTNLKALNISTEAEHISIIDNVLEDETENLKYVFYFVDNSIHINPMKGSLWPQSEINFLITFLPTKPMVYKTMAYLEVDGLKERYKVAFEGLAIGPNIALNMNVIDFGKIFICSQPIYAVMATNVGHVKGTLRFVQKSTLCGGEITCEPPDAILFPEKYQLLEIKITSTMSGHFVEEIHFLIEESGEKLQLTVKGEIINPRLIFDKEKIDFGKIALGIPSTETLTLRNDSAIPVKVEMSVDGDGTMPVVRIDTDVELLLPSDPKEFEIQPSSATIESGDKLDIEVTVVSNRVRRHKTSLNIFLWGVLVEESSPILVYDAQIPQLTVNPPELVLRYAFTGFEYCYKLTVCNETNLPTYFFMLPQEADYNPFIVYRLENESGYLQEQACQLVLVYIKVLTVKPCNERIRLRVFGLNHIVQACTIRAYGMGPVVNPSTFSISWGQIPIMAQVEKKLQLINVSPIPAYYKLDFMKRQVVWQTDRHKGVILADSSVEVTLTAQVRDSGPVTDQLWVEISGSRDIMVDLSASGEGISIFTEPTIFPLYDIGTVFRKEKQKQVIKVRNVGTKHHTLLFTTTKDFKKMTKLTAAKEQGQYFKLNPYRLDLPGGAVKDIVLSYKWDEEAVLEDTYYCYGTIGNTGKRVTFGTSTIRATFTDPQFIFEPKQVYFRIDLSEEDTIIEPLHQTINLTSLWNTKLNAECKLKPPFRFSSVYRESHPCYRQLVLEPGEVYTLDLYFDPPNAKSRRNRVIRDVLVISYIGHTVKTSINLIGEMNYPNLSISLKQIHLGCVSPGGEGVCQAQLKNVSPLPVRFEWIWEKVNTFSYLSVIEEVKQDSSLVTMATSSTSTTEKTSEGGSEVSMETWFPKAGSILRRSGSKAAVDHHSFYRNIIAEKYFTEDGVLPKNLEVFVRELMGAKYEYEKRLSEDTGRKENWKVDVYSHTLQTADLRRKSTDLFVRSSIGSVDTIDTEESSCVLSDGLKAALGIATQSSTTSSVDDLESLVAKIPADVLPKDVLSNLTKYKKEERLPTVEEPIDRIPQICKIINISPSRDVLEPKDCLMTTFTFRPNAPIWVQASALCKVGGGPSEVLYITGYSYPPMYEVYPKLINFGIGIFCEVWCSSILIWNKSLKEINVVVRIPCEPTFRKDEENPNILPLSVGIHPSKKTVKPFETSTHEIMLYPGHVGEIDQLIFVEIDNEKPIHIHFVGYAVPNQIHLSLHHHIQDVDIVKMYHAIGRLTSHWFQLDLREILNFQISNEELEDILHFIEVNYLERDWDLLMTKNDLVPTVDDINMAYERYLFEEYCSQFEGVIPHHSLGEHKYFGLILPAYFVDFGLVIAGTKAVYSIQYRNYFPLKTYLKVIHPKDTQTLDKFGVTIKLPSSVSLKAFEEKVFEIYIRPTKDLFQHEEFEKEMNFDFYMEVGCGGIIPVVVKALITIPVLVAPKLIDFEGVKIGYRRIIKFKLTNVSKVDCEWFGVLSTSNTPVYYLSRKAKTTPKNCPFFIKPVYGYLNPKHYTIISVVFEPQHEVPFEVDIHFYTNMNSKYSKVRLRGFGMEQRLLIRDVSFGYGIPYSGPRNKRLTIFNPTLFPAEVLIHGEDKKQKLETVVATTLLDYYGTSKLCVPSYFFSTHITDSMWKMYENLATSAIRKYVQDTANFLNVIVKQSLSKSLSRLRSISENSLTSTHKTRIIKKLNHTKSFSLGKGRDIKKIKIEPDKFSRQSTSASTNKNDVVDMIIQKHLTKKNLQDVIMDYVRTINIFKCPRTNLIDIEQSDVENNYYIVKEGSIVIVHPSPLSYSGTFSWLLAKHTGMKPISIDKVIYDDIKNGKSEESLFIRDALYNYYYEEKRNISQMIPEYILRKKEFDRLNFPLKTIKDLIRFAAKNYFLKTKDSSSYSSYSLKMKYDKTIVNNTLLNIPIEYFHAIIKRRLFHKLKSGIIIKKLSSQFLLTPVNTLNFLLDLFKNHQNLNVISLYSSLEHHLKLNKNALDPVLIDYFQGITGKNIHEVTASYVKKFGEEFVEQKKILSRSGINSYMKDKLKKRSTRMSTATYYRSKYKPKIQKSLRVTEMENEFNTYQRELLEIREILEAYEKYPLKMHSSSHSGGSSGTGKMKRIDLLRRLQTISLTRVDTVTDNRIGIPHWTLYNYPYCQDYQFSIFPEILASLETIKTLPSDKKPTELNNDIISKKSYFVIKRQTSLDEHSSAMMMQDEDVFKLSPVLKIKKKKHFPLKINSDIEQSNLDIGNNDQDRETNKSPKSKRYFSSQSGSGGSKSSDKLNFVQGRINKLCGAMEDDLLADLESYTKKKCKNKFTRQLVKPGKFISWDVQFQPVGCRFFTHCISFGINGCNTVKHVNVTGGSDIPDISFDPFVLYPQVLIECSDYENIFFPCFIVEENLFHFGKIIVNANDHLGSENGSGGNNFISTSEVRIKNTSNVDVNVTITLIGEDKFNSLSPEIYVVHRHSVGHLRRKTHSNITLHKMHTAPRRISKKNVSIVVGKSIRRKFGSRLSTEEKRAFQCNYSELKVPVGETKSISISSSPIKSGIHTQIYILSIENNPKIYYIKAICNGIIVKVDFRPKEILFEEVVLYRALTKCFLIDNISNVPLMWKVIDVESLSPVIVLSMYEGYLNPTGQETVSITYQANSIERTTKDLTIVIFSPLRKDIELQRYVYKLVLKSYSVDVNFHFEMSGNDHLTLIDVGIEEPIDTKLVIQNLGPHPISYLLLINEQELIKVKKDFTVNIKDDTGSLRSKDICSIEITMHCSSEMTLTNIAFLIIEIYDYGTEELIARIPGYISLQSFYPEFVLKPTQYLYFGDMEIGSSKSLELTLENTGSINLYFAFKHGERSVDFQDNPQSKSTAVQFLNFSESMEEKSSPKLTLNLLKKLAQLKKILFLHRQKLFVKNIYWKLKIPSQNIPEKELDKYVKFLKKIKTRLNIARKKKVFKPSVYLPDIEGLDGSQLAHDGPSIREKSVYFPPFKIFPSEGAVKAGKFIVCTVSCSPHYIGTYRMVVNLKIHHARPEHSIVSVELNATCSQPKVNLDFVSIFRDFVITDKSSTFPYEQFNHEGMPFGIFNTLSKDVKFCNVPIGSCESFNIYLKSETHLISTITISVSDGEVFKVRNQDILKISIPPYETVPIPVTFCPIDLSECRGNLEFNLRTIKNVSISSVNFSLSGVGCIPSIYIERPMHPDEVPYPMTHIKKIDFEFVHLNHSSTKVFSIKNIGVIICDLWLEINPYNENFEVSASKEAMKATLNSTISDIFDSSLLFRIKPSEKISFEAKYNPSSVGVHSLNIPIHIVNNPYELITIKLVGECYQNELIISGLECMTLSSSIGFKANLMEYRMDFGSCCLGWKYQKKFIIHNNTFHIIKFEFIQENHDITFIPSIGHMFHNSKKEVTALLLANNARNLKHEMSLTYNGIAYKDDPISDSEWDNTVKVISLLEEKKISLDMEGGFYYPISTNCIIEEPDYATLNLISGAVYLVANAIVDKPVLEATLTDINFNPVLLGQMSNYSFKITNRCNIEVNFDISINYKEEEKLQQMMITEISFGKFSYDLKQFYNLDNESFEDDLCYNWPSKLPPDLELYEYCSLFLKREKKSDLDKWEYLKDKHVCQLQDLPETYESSMFLYETKLCESSVSLDQKSIDTVLLRKEGVSLKDFYVSTEKHETMPPKHSEKCSFWTNIKCGTVKPAETLEITASFSPSHIMRFKSELCICSNNGSILKTINLSGSGFLPLCHIEIEEDDSHLEYPKFDLIPYRTKSVLVTTYACDTVTKRIFKVYNITEIPFHFKWYCLKNSPKEEKFKCFTEEGTIYPRGSGEMLFSFCPVEHGTYNSLWLLCIREFILIQPILFIGISKEPTITVSPKTVKLRPTFKGSKTSAEIKLINHENTKLNFFINKESFAGSSSVYSRINLTPMEGEILPNATTSLMVQYKPDQHREESVPFSLCIVPSKREISFTVIITKFTIVPVVSCLKENLEKINIFYEDKKNNISVNTISIGKISLLKPYKLEFTIKNMGEIPFHYELFVPKEENISLDIEQLAGLVQPNKHHSLFVKVSVQQKISFKQQITIKVSQGPTFNVQINGSAAPPLYDFSFEEYNFGACVIQKSDPLMYSSVLQFFNSEYETVLIETKGCKEVFTVNLKSVFVQPRSIHKILIVFNPVQAVKYKETLIFLINSTFEHSITLTGEGDDFNVEIDSPENQLVDFGLVKAGTLANKEVTLINKSQALSLFTLFLKERNANISRNKLELKPFGKLLKLKPNETCTVQISFFGAERLKDYSAAVECQAYGEKKILFCVKATVIDYEFSVDQISLLFGPTTVGCSSVLKFAITNSGDIGARYKIDTDLLSEVFAVKPVAGYSPPGSVTVIEVTFFPSTATQYYNNMLICLIKDYRPMTINITGIGVRIPVPMRTIKFFAEVRQIEKRFATIRNSSNIEQTVKPLVDGTYFSGPESINIPPKGEAEYEITYSPMTQTLHHYHLGSAFCSFPDGQSYLFKLLGSAGPTKSSSPEIWHCFSKHRFKGQLTFENWSAVSETFSVDLVFTSASSKIFCILEFEEAICIPAKTERKFTIGLICFKECNIDFEAIVSNIVTKECKKYSILVNVAPYNISNRIKLKGHVRQKCVHKISLFNPTNKSTTFVFRSPSPEIKPKSKLIKIKPGKKKYLKLNYIPFDYGSIAVFVIEVHNELLGTLSEEVTFVSSKIKENDVEFEAHISTPVLFSIPLKNPSTKISSCFAFTDSSDLLIRNEIFNIPPRRTYNLQVLFNPSFIGELIFNIVICTDKIGNIHYRAKCRGNPPKPQGFILLPRGGIYKLVFENVLKIKASFLCEVNNQEFICKNPGFTLSPGEEQTIEVQHITFYSFTSTLGIEDSCCKVTVICTTFIPALIWTYYLRAKPALPLV